MRRLFGGVREEGVERAAAAAEDVGGRGGAESPPKPSFDVIRKLWKVGSMYFFGDRKAKARFLLFIVLVLCAVCAGPRFSSPCLAT